MANLIDRNGSRPDTWQWWPDDSADDVPLSGDWIISLTEWRARPTAWQERSGRVGVVFKPADDPLGFAPDLPSWSLIAVQFPSFTDGRGYSTARILRERLGYRGELRAVGDILRDQLFWLARCGFDTFALRPDQDVAAALTAFKDFSVRYQAATDEPLPLFRRRVG